MNKEDLRIIANMQIQIDMLKQDNLSYISLINDLKQEISNLKDDINYKTKQINILNTKIHECTKKDIKEINNDTKEINNTSIFNRLFYWK
jgi:hypothetical protein